MRSYNELIEVRRGLVSGQEVPAQFIWRDKLWVVRDVISHWIETGVWWERAGVSALFGIGRSSTAVDSPAVLSRPHVSAELSQAGAPGARSPADLAPTPGSAEHVQGDTRIPDTWTTDIWAAEASGTDRWGGDLLGEQEFWRIEAARGRPGWRSRGGEEAGAGVFDLSFDWAGGQWHLVRSID